MRQKIIELINSIRPELKLDGQHDTQLFGELDSLDIIFLVEAIEEQMNISIEADQIIPENFSSLYVLEEFIKGYTR